MIVFIFLLFTMLLHTVPALVFAAIYNDLCMSCRCNLQYVWIPALVFAAMYNAFASLRYFLLLSTTCLHTRVSFLLLFNMNLNGCVHFCCYLQCVCICFKDVSSQMLTFDAGKIRFGRMSVAKCLL